MFFAKSGENAKNNAIIIFCVSGFLDLLFVQVTEAMVLSCVRYLSYQSKIMKNLNVFIQKIRVWKSTKTPDSF